MAGVAPKPPASAAVRVAGVLTNVLTGTDPFRRRLVQDLLTRRPHDEAWALLDNTGGPALDGHGAHLVSLDKDCMCCAGGVTLRVTLTRLLRQARPGRLIVLPSSEARLPEVLKVLSDPWLSAALDLRAAIALVHAGDWHAGPPAAREAMLALVREARLAAVEFGDDAMAGGTLRAALAGVASIVDLGGAPLPFDLLDQPGVIVRRRFPAEDD